MAKRKRYKYNPETLSFEVESVTLLSKLKRYIVTFLFGSVIATVWIFVFSLFFNTPKESSLLKETYELLSAYDVMLMKLSNTENILDNIMERDNKVYRAVFEEDTIPYSIRNAGFGGTDRYSKYEDLGITNSQLLVQSYRLLDVLNKKAYIQSKSLDRIAELAANKTLMQQSMPISAPTELRKVRFRSDFGYRTDPVYGDKRFHEGIDLSGSTGIPIYASGDGVVVRATFSGAYSYGNVVDIDHGFGYLTRYAHLNKYDVVPGQKVKRGDKIGELGNTGKSTGPHLHYEIRLKGVPQNPTLYFDNTFDEEEYIFIDQGDAVIYED